ncbi:MAG: N-acetylmuramoyl-L-alanine amidase [Candidatus Omnitrophica bacterium]|nr:N-acetylmuramoyl-L-alanine amidase [Candidatus Omnitrophota bacterium]
MKRIYFLVFSFVLLTGCATLPKTAGKTPSGDVSAQDLCRKYNIECRWDSVSQTITLFYLNKKVQGLVGSDMVVVGNNRIALSAPLYRKRGLVMLPPDFERAVFGPAPVPQEDYIKGAQTGRLKKVVVDAGHGGKDSGALGVSGLKEKDINLDIARRVKKDFEAAGVEAVMTRDTDDFITLADRTAIASRPDTDLFVSIHANANKARRAGGIEVYYAGTLSRDDRGDDQRQANERKLCSLFNMRSDIPDLKGIVTDMLYSYKSGMSPGLSDAVARGLLHETPRQSRGSKPERFFVLRNTLIPAVLVEVGFVTNPKEASLLKDEAYRQRLADSITKSILRCVYDSGI